MLAALSVIIILLGFSLMPFIVSVLVSGDVFSGKGNMKVTLFGITVFKAEIRLESVSALEKNIVVTSGKKRDEIHLNADKDDDKSIVSLLKTLPIMSYIIIERLSVDVSVGLKNNAFVTTMATGILRTFLSAFTSFLANRQHIEIERKVTPEYNSDRMDFELFGIIKISLANIINSFIAGIMNKLKVKAASNGKRSLKYKVKIKE